MLRRMTVKFIHSNALVLCKKAAHSSREISKSSNTEFSKFFINLMFVVDKGILPNQQKASLCNNRKPVTDI